MNKVSKLRKIFITAYFVIPYIVINITRQYDAEWMGRLIALYIFYFLGAIAFLYLSLNPKVEIIAKDARLKRVTSAKNVKRIEYGARIFLLALGLSVLSIAIPFAKDASSFKNIVIIEGKVTDKSVPFGGVWFIHQSITFDNGTDLKSYSLLYSFTPIKEDHRYQLKILKNTRNVLEFKKLD